MNKAEAEIVLNALMDGYAALFERHLKAYDDCAGAQTPMAFSLAGARNAIRIISKEYNNAEVCPWEDKSVKEEEGGSIEDFR